MIYKFYTSTNVTLAVGQEGANTLPNTFAFSEPFQGECVGPGLICRQQPTHLVCSRALAYSPVLCARVYVSHEHWRGARASHSLAQARTRGRVLAPATVLWTGKTVAGTSKHRIVTPPRTVKGASARGCLYHPVGGRDVSWLQLVAASGAAQSHPATAVVCCSFLRAPTT